MFTEKRTVVIDKLKIEYATSGMGSPAIVLVNGAGGPLEGWHKLLPHLERLGAVLAYNRPGVGRSAKPVEPQTGDVIVRSLRGLLGHLRLSPPYVLVGHSLGGLYVNLYARSFPDEVTGVVLLDAAAPEDAGLVSEYSTAIQRAAQRLLDALLGSDELGEAEYVSDTVDLIRQAGPFPPVPLVVVTGGKPSRTTPRAVRVARADHQTGLVALSPLGRQVIAGRSGHFPQMSEPVVVVEAIREVLALAAAGMANRGIQRTPQMPE